MYITAAQRFEKIITRVMILIVVMITITMICVFATILMCVRTHEFINKFEYIEETEVEITQDAEGMNTAVVGSENEVKIKNGSENSG